MPQHDAEHENDPAVARKAPGVVDLELDDHGYDDDHRHERRADEALPEESARIARQQDEGHGGEGEDHEDGDLGQLPLLKSDLEVTLLNFAAPLAAG